MASIVFSPTATKLRGFNQDDDFTYAVASTPLGTPGGVVASSIYDANTLITTTTGSTNLFRLDVSKSLVNPDNTLVFSSDDPGVVTVDQTGQTFFVAAGAASVRIKAGGIERRYTQNVSTVGNLTSETVESYKAGSLGQHVWDYMLGLVGGKTPQGTSPDYGGTQNLFTQNNHHVDGTNNAVRNTAFFADVLADKFCALACGNLDGAGTPTSIHPPILVSPRHVYGAKHYHAANGTAITFRKPDGSYQTVTILSSYTNASDHWIGYLSAPIAASIAPLKVMPANWRSFIKSCDQDNGGAFAWGILPVFTKVMHNPAGGWSDRVSISYLQSVYTPTAVGYSDSLSVGGAWFSSTATFYSWAGMVRGGDSGGMVAMPVNGELVLLGGWWSAGGFQEIQSDPLNLETEMRNLATANGDSANDPYTGVPYAFIRADLSAFTPY